MSTLSNLHRLHTLVDKSYIHIRNKEILSLPAQNINELTAVLPKISSRNIRRLSERCCWLPFVEKVVSNCSETSFVCAVCATALLTDGKAPETLVVGLPEGKKAEIRPLSRLIRAELRGDTNFHPSRMENASKSSRSMSWTFSLETTLTRRRNVSVCWSSFCDSSSDIRY